MARLSNTFDFVGTLRFGKSPVDVRESDSGWVQKKLKASINETNNNGVFINLEGGFSKTKPNKVFTFTKGIFGEKGGMLEVAWDNRFDESTLYSVSDFKKVVIDLTEDAEVKSKFWDLRKEINKLEQEGNPTQETKDKLAKLYKEIKENSPDRHEFLHPVDAVEFLEKNADELKGKRFRTRGSVDISYWNEKFYTNYNVQSMELVINEEVPNKLAATLDLYFGKDVADKSTWKKDSKILYNTYIICYDRGHKADKLFPYQTLFNGEKFDFEDNPKHKAYLNLLDKIFTTKSKVVSHIPFDVKIVSGAEEVEFSEKNLTAEQQLLIDAGIATIDEFKTRTFGDKVNEVRLTLPILKDLEDKGNFKTGSLESEFTPEDLVYVPAESNYKPKPQEDDPFAPSKGIIEIDEDSLPF